MNPVQPKRGRCLTARQAATYLGISEGQLRSLIASGRIPVRRHDSGRLAGVYEADCDEYLATAVRAEGSPTPSASAAVDAYVRAQPGATTFH